MQQSLQTSNIENKVLQARIALICQVLIVFMPNIYGRQPMQWLANKACGLGGCDLCRHLQGDINRMTRERVELVAAFDQQKNRMALEIAQWKDEAARGER